jgi:hypothetical protein
MENIFRKKTGTSARARAHTQNTLYLMYVLDTLILPFNFKKISSQGKFHKIFTDKHLSSLLHIFQQC